MKNQAKLTEMPNGPDTWRDPKILVVEDDPKLCESIRTLLDHHGFAVWTSENLLEALDALLAVEYDLILLDLKLGDKCGFTVMDHLVERNLDTRVIVVTGHHSEKYAITALKKGAIDYLKKPIDPDDLLTSVNNVLVSQKYHRELGLLKALVASSSAAIVVAEDGGRIVYANPAYRRLMDPHNADEIDSPVIRARPVDRETHVDEQIREALVAGTPWEGKIELVDSVGRRFEAWKWVDPIPETIRGVSYGAAVLHEVTTQTQSEKNKFHNPDAASGHARSWDSEETGIVCSRRGEDSHGSRRNHAEERLPAESKKRTHPPVRVKQLSGTLPICASCKKVRDDDGTWNEIEAYIESRSGSRFSHSLCPQCARRLYPDLYP